MPAIAQLHCGEIFWSIRATASARASHRTAGLIIPQEISCHLTNSAYWLS